VGATGHTHGPTGGTDPLTAPIQHGNVLSDEARFLHGAQTNGPNGEHGRHHGSGDLSQALGGQLRDDLMNLLKLVDMLKHGQDTSGHGFQTTQEFIGSSGALANLDNKGQHDLKNHTLNHIVSDK